ncbi:DUF4268 domain-containing protein [Paracnuella aquatica]|uniref:DUF4268 domain-containing protein n=1 Tax=Paracnuella aquatica TaxID=2268757 RepID=UPI000DEFB190|nr:DUF4268 domain-containing protein [Paracnuella aquatica]RPD43606.1 DUF4268 domain-containing protein [Paracnuella aquatica]
MFSRQEASRIRQEFWTAFGLYMAPVHSADGEKINWINYKTGEKHVQFRMDAGSNAATIGIEMRHPDAGVRHLFMEQLQQVKKILEAHLGESWTWQHEAEDENGKAFSRVYQQLPNVSVFRKDDWPALVSFFKPRIRALDAFWSEARYSFEALR